MKKVTFKCEVITPMFMAGADGKTPELRPSEFKGMMRFWWRAAKAENDIERLKKEEADIFGGTGEGVGKSKVKIILKASNPPVGENILNEIGGKSGCKYLLYSTFSFKAEREQIIKKYIKPTYEFDIMLQAGDENSLRNALASFWLSVYLGGFGTRARRGGGNLAIKGIEPTYFPELNFIPQANNKEELSKWITENLDRIKLIITQGNTEKYSNLKGAKILILNPHKKWIDALEYIGAKFKDFRNRNKSELWKMAAFGMPVMHSGFKIRMVPYRENVRISDRLGSPLIIKVIKSGSLFFPTVIRLNFDIGRVGKEKKEEKRNEKQKKVWQKAQSSDIKHVSLEKVDEFLNSLKSEAKEILV